MSHARGRWHIQTRDPHADPDLQSVLGANFHVEHACAIRFRAKRRQRGAIGPRLCPLVIPQVMWVGARTVASLVLAAKLLESTSSLSDAAQTERQSTQPHRAQLHSRSAGAGTTVTPLVGSAIPRSCRWHWRRDSASRGRPQAAAGVGVRHCGPATEGSGDEPATMHRAQQQRTAAMPLSSGAAQQER